MTLRVWFEQVFLAPLDLQGGWHWEQYQDIEALAVSLLGLLRTCRAELRDSDGWLKNKSVASLRAYVERHGLQPQKLIVTVKSRRTKVVLVVEETPKGVKASVRIASKDKGEAHELRAALEWRQATGVWTTETTVSEQPLVAWWRRPGVRAVARWVAAVGIPVLSGLLLHWLT